MFFLLPVFYSSFTLFWRYRTDINVSKVDFCAATLLKVHHTVTLVETLQNVNGFNISIIFNFGAKSELFLCSVSEAYMSLINLKGQFTPKPTLHICPLTCSAIYQSR